MARSSVPRAPSAAMSSSRPTTSTPRSRWLRGSRRLVWVARSRYVRSGRIGNCRHGGRPRPMAERLRGSHGCSRRHRCRREHDEVTAAENDWLAGRFEEHRTHLRSVAYRMLGSVSAADDAVQEAWLRLSRSDTSDVENLRGWLTTVVGRVCLNMLHSRHAQHEEPQGVHIPDPLVSRDDEVDPEHEALLAESVSLALVVVLETLAPAERLAL